MYNKKINSALISVYLKNGLEEIVARCIELDIKIYSTGGTQKYIESLGAKVIAVEDLTSYPSILDGRVKTLHPKVFGGILARRDQDHLEEINKYSIPEIDLVVVDLYPFEETLKQSNDESTIIEKIYIGGISLIRAAAKNFKDVVVIPSFDSYPELLNILTEQDGITSINERKRLALEAFNISSHYDTHIYQYFNRDFKSDQNLKISSKQANPLRYGENPHQQASFFGSLNEKFELFGGKPLSYNNLVDIDAAVDIMSEFRNQEPTFAILKHTNPCGIATRSNILDAWKAALAGDPISAFGGILIANTEIDLATATEINKIFYEVLIAPGFDEEALALLRQKKKRILMKITNYDIPANRLRTILNGVIYQESDSIQHTPEEFEVKTALKPVNEQFDELLFANKCVKHLKSNTIVFTKNKQLLGMGCGQTSRVDACKQAIDKAIRMGFDLDGAVMASDAFFPFPDCVQLADEAGVKTIIQPGGSIKDQLSIDYCDQHKMAMVFTGVRHFKH